MSWLHPFKIEHRYAPIAWGIACASIALLVTAVAKIRFVPAEVMQILSPVVIGLGVVGMLEFFRYRLAADTSRIGGILRTAGQRGADMLIVLCGIVLTFHAAAAGYPLQDAMFSRIDGALGFQWHAVMAWFDAHPPIARSMRHIYYSVGAQIPALFLLFLLLGHTNRIREFVALYTLSLMTVALVAMLLPARGAFAFYQPAPDLLMHLSPRAGRYFIPLFDALHSGRLSLVRLEHVTGIVQFPSFHTAIAVLTIYACRGIPVLFWPAAVINLGVIVSTVPEGGHFLSDILGGAAIAGTAIAVAARWLWAGLPAGEQKIVVPAWWPWTVTRPLGT
jgi:membrane-associated phospholipid phosphatase